MTTRYLDPTLAAAITDGSYSITNRDNSGSDGNAYPTYAAAIAASANDDTIICRSGTEIATAAVSTALTGLTISPYQEEMYTWDGSASNIAGWTFTGANSGFVLGDGFIKIKGAPSSNLAGLTVNQATFKCDTDGKGRLILNWRPTGTGAGAASINVAAAVEVTMKNVVFDRILVRAHTGTAGHTLTLENVTYKNCGHYQLSVVGTLNLNGVTIAGNTGTRELVENSAGAATVVVNNPLMIGHGAGSAAAQFQSAGTLTVNGGIVHKNMANAGISDGAGVTLNNVDNSKLVRFQKDVDAGVRCLVSICFNDMTHATNSKLSDYIAAAAPYGVKMTYMPDDIQSIYENPELANSVTQKAQINAWLAAGHELGSAGISGSDPWTQTIINPFQITATHTLTDLKLSITGDGTVWRLTSTDAAYAGQGGIIAEWDCSRDGAQKYLGLYEASIVGLTADRVLDQLDNFTDANIYSIVVTNNAAQHSGLGFDDAHAEMMKDAEIALVSGVANTSLEIDWTKRCDVELTYANTLFQSVFGVSPVSFYAAGSAPNTVMSSYANSNGWDCIVFSGSAVPNQPLATLNPLSATFALDAGGTDSGLSKTGGEDAIRAAARRLASWGFAQGGWFPIQMSTSVFWTTEQLGWLIDELVNCGVEIVTCAEAAALAGTNAVPNTYDYTLADCPAVGAGKKWWTGVNPVSANGEPFSDWDTDPGAFQSTHGPFHPANL